MVVLSKYLLIFLAIFLAVAILLSSGNALVFAEANTIAPVVEYTIYKPSPNETYANTMMIDFNYNISYKESGVKSLGLSNYYSIDKGANQSFPTHWYVKAADISKLSNGTHELNVYVDAQYVYNNTVFSNTFQLFSINFKVLESSPAPTSTVPEFPIAASLVTVLAVVSLLLIVGKRRANNQSLGTSFGA
jgi:hypothetical protein